MNITLIQINNKKINNLNSNKSNISKLTYIYELRDEKLKYSSQINSLENDKNNIINDHEYHINKLKNELKTTEYEIKRNNINLETKIEEKDNDKYA